MHAAVLQLAPILGAEKSKVPFYIAGGLLVAWALVISVGIGMRREDFPGTLGAERAVIGITILLVVVTLTAAVATSGDDNTSKTASATTTVKAAAAGGTVTATSTAPNTTATSGSPGTPAPPAAAGASTLLALAANPAGQLSYNTTRLAAHAGTVTIVMTNMSPEEHNVTVAEGRKVLGATPTFVGGSKRLTLTLKPGSYTFYCSVPGHRQAGMEGTLTIS